jgi:hypothetical protein
LSLRRPPAHLLLPASAAITITAALVSAAITITAALVSAASAILVLPAAVTVSAAIATAIPATLSVSFLSESVARGRQCKNDTQRQYSEYFSVFIRSHTVFSQTTNAVLYVSRRCNIHSRPVSARFQCALAHTRPVSCAGRTIWGIFSWKTCKLRPDLRSYARGQSKAGVFAS